MTVIGEATDSLLDLFSTSQKIQEKCIHHAPYLCVPQDGEKAGYFAQGCCNDWLCPRCGQMRARHEYGRMVNGAREIAADHKLWFVTITCTGDSDWQKAERDYLSNTNRLLSTLRANANKNKCYWSYASVTERQSRKHPHSHFLTTYKPPDAFNMSEHYSTYQESVSEVNSLIPEEMRFTPLKQSDVYLLDWHSNYLMLKSVAAGLGVQARLSEVDSVEACSRYIAKYLFKESAFTVWPKGWKRVRYSQNWPKLPEKHNDKAFIVLTAWDWYLAADSGHLVTRDYDAYERACRQGLRNVEYIVPDRKN